MPVYTVLIGAQGKTLAFECEAQEGLHVTVNCLAGAGWTAFFQDGERPSSTIMAVIDSKLCECGRPGHRLVEPRALAKGPHRAGSLTLPPAAGILA